ncbi:MAG TPA: PAS domain S-box protein [Bryobacteraceae bacterium]|nr:PAS domain S-box protein [Bryobacteraceae bacterium]
MSAPSATPAFHDECPPRRALTGLWRLKLTHRLVLTFLAASAASAAYEAASFRLLPAITLERSAAAMLVWSGLIAALAVFVSLRRHGPSRCGLVDEISWLSSGLFAAIEQAAEGIVITSVDSTIQYVNPAFSRMTGYSPEEAVGQTLRILKSGRQDRAYYEDLWKTVTAGQVWHGELTNRRKDGTLYTEQMTITPVRDPSGAIVNYIAIKQDVTARQAGEEAQRLLASIVESSEDAIISHSPENVIASWNRGAEALFGYTADEMIGKSVTLLVPPDQLSFFYQTTGGLDAGKKVSHLEAEVLAKSGRRITVSISLSVIRNDAGKITNVAAIIRDMTAAKQSEEELKRAKEAAEAANQAKSAFLANMSHEIRTPMNAILGMTELMLDTPLNAEQREYAEIVKTSADSLLTVINDILDFSKIEARKLDLECIPFNLRAAVDSTMKALAIRAHEKNLELACRVATEVPATVVGDPGRLRQVLVNLVGNAIKFTEQGEVVVHVSRQQETAEHSVLAFRVRDTGIGIAPEKHQAIFDAFEQADISTTRRFGGTGLGLAITSQLVSMMGGRIWLESQVGDGSTFHFTVRFGRAEPLSDRPEQMERGILQDLPVLVADRSDTQRRILSEILSRAGMKPAIAGCERDTMAMLQRARQSGRPFKLAVLDAHLCGADTFALVEAIKNDPQLAGSTIIMLTSAGLRGDGKRSQETGVSAYLTKPVSESELVETIVRSLGTNVAPHSGAPQLITRHSLREPRNRLRILIVEDHPVNQRLAVRLLEKQGHSAVCANNGRSALAVLRRDRFDLVLMDIQMPEMDGIETTCAIRESERGTRYHIPIVAMTAHTMQGDRERCVAAGMDGYVAKPLKAAELSAAIDQAVWAAAGGAAPVLEPQQPEFDAGLASVSRAVFPIEIKP